MAYTGRDLLIKKGVAAIGGLRETGYSVDSSPIDITSKDDGGHRALAGFSGVESLDISGTGVVKDSVLQDIAFAGAGTSKLMTDITIEWGDGASVSGDFYLASYESNGNHDGEETYSLTLQSSEAWTYTAAV